MAAETSIPNSKLNAGRDIHISAHSGYKIPKQDPIKLLQSYSALGALHDSAERPDPPKCHPDTREAVLERIDQWARDGSENAKPILWLTGAAGAGKSAIAQTLIEKWKEEGLIIPNFFCWRTSPRRNQKGHLMPTLSFQLTKSHPAAKAKIKKAVKDESIFEHNLKSQVTELIVDPLEDIMTEERLVVIVIDGLDEVCVDLTENGGFPGQSSEDQQREIMEAMAFACQKLPSLRIFIASRPERQIRSSFSEPPLDSLSLSLSLVDEPNASADITLYLDCKFAQIRQRYPGIDPTWPSRKQISLLVEKSSGQFIYPSTVVNYISQGRQFPVKSLEEVLALQVRSDQQRKHPLAELDALYALVLRSVMPESRPIVSAVLGLMCHGNILHSLPPLHNIMPSLKPQFLAIFLLLSLGEFIFHLTDMHSLLYIKNPLELRFMHATLSEYLIDQSRSGDFSIHRSHVYTQCALLLLRYSDSMEGSKTYIRFLSNIFKNFIPFCSPSADLMKKLWELFTETSRNGSPYNVSPPLSLNGRDSVIFHHPDLAKSQVRSQVLSYLQSCNTTEIEPSESRREEKRQRLNELIAQIRPGQGRSVEHAPALERGDRSTDEQGEEVGRAKRRRGELQQDEAKRPKKRRKFKRRKDEGTKATKEERV